MTTTDIDICTHALVMIGAQPITSFADGTTEATVAANLYETTVRDLLTRHRWRFATVQQVLSRLADAPLAGWDAAYQVPADTLMIHTVLVNGLPIDFDRFEDRVFCNAGPDDEVVIETTYRVAEQFWAPYFIALTETMLASIFAYAVAGNEGVSDFLERRALRQLAAARTFDSQAQTARKLTTDRLIRGRY